jgi:hypothetical protein
MVNSDGCQRAGMKTVGVSRDRGSISPDNRGIPGWTFLFNSPRKTRKALYKFTHTRGHPRFTNHARSDTDQEQQLIVSAWWCCPSHRGCSPPKPQANDEIRSHHIVPGSMRAMEVSYLTATTRCSARMRAVHTTGIGASDITSMAAI